MTVAPQSSHSSGVVLRVLDMEGLWWTAERGESQGCKVALPAATPSPRCLRAAKDIQLDAAIWVQKKRTPCRSENHEKAQKASTFPVARLGYMQG